MASLITCSAASLGARCAVGDPAPQRSRSILLVPASGSSVEEEHAPRMLVGRAVGERELLELFLGDAVRRRAHDEGVRHLALQLVVEGHHQRLVHGGMALRAAIRPRPERCSRRRRRTCRRCGRRNSRSRRRRGGRRRRCNTSRRAAASRSPPAGCDSRAGCRDSSARVRLHPVPGRRRASPRCRGRARRASRRARLAFRVRAERHRAAFGHAVHHQRLGIRESARAVP